MGLEFRFRRIKNDVADDAEPTAATTRDVVFPVPVRRPELGTVAARGWIYYLIFRDANAAEVLDGKATVTVYLRDESDLSWFSMAPDREVGHRAGYSPTTLVNGAAAYFRVTDIAGTGVASVEVRVEPV